MKVIQAIVFVANVLLLLIADAFLWTISWRWGLGGIIGIVGFFIGYSLSGGMTLAPRDYWRNSQYAVFKKKLAYGNSIAGVTAVIASLVLMAFSS